MKENSVLIINGSEMVTNLILLLLPFPVSSCILHQAGLNARQWTLFMPLYAALIRGYFSKIFPRTASTYNTHFFPRTLNQTTKSSHFVKTLD